MMDTFVEVGDRVDIYERPYSNEELEGSGLVVNVYDSSANRTGYNRTFQLGAMIPIKTGIKKKDKNPLPPT